MYINSHALGSRKSETILDTNVYVMNLLALWLNHLFNRFSLSQLETKFALGGDLDKLIMLLKPLNH